MSSGTTGSPQTETPVNGEGDIKTVVENASPTSETSSKVISSPTMNVGGNSGVAGAGDSLQTMAAGARPAGGGMVAAPQTHGAANPPPLNRAGIVPMSRVSGGGGGGPPPPNQSGWHQSQYSNRPAPQMARYNNDGPPAGYGNYRTRPMNNQQSGGEALSKTNLYIRGLIPSTTDQDLINLCQQYGKIKSTKAIVDQQTNRCKGYGFVDFEKPSDAERAVQVLQQSGVQAQMAKVRENSLDQDPTNLYIANLPDYVDESYLESMVRPYGAVVSVRILKDQAGMTRNVGFCRMETKEMCERIVAELNKKIIPGSKEPLLVKFADSGNRRRREYRTHQQHPMMGGYDSISHGHMGGQVLSQGNVGLNRYSMQAVNNQSTYIPNTATGNWGSVPMYPQLAMSPANPVTSIQSNIMDPSSVLATQLGQMQIATGPAMATASIPNYGMQQSQQSYPQMYQNQGMMQPFQYEMSASPPTHIGHVMEEHNNYQGFGQM